LQESRARRSSNAAIVTRDSVPESDPKEKYSIEEATASTKCPADEVETPSKRTRTGPEYAPDSKREGMPVPLMMPMSLYDMFTPPGENGFTQSGDIEPLKLAEEEIPQSGEGDFPQPGEDNSLTEPESSEDEHVGRKNNLY
jgi:hypothetical protein